MSKEIAKKTDTPVDFSDIERVVMQGDLSKLNPEQRVTYYRQVCQSAGLNPFTRPFDYITLNGKLTLYAKKDATEQLRHIKGISIVSLEDKVVDDLYIVTATARTKDGRTDEAKGAVSLANLRGEQKANAIMKAETKAKRRVTLSISGMGWTDESEIESIPGAVPLVVDLNTGELEINSATKNTTKKVETASVEPKINQEQANDLAMIVSECDPNYQTWFTKTHGTNLLLMPLGIFPKVKDAALKRMNEHHSRQLADSERTPIVMEMSLAEVK